MFTICVEPNNLALHSETGWETLVSVERGGHTKRSSGQTGPSHRQAHHTDRPITQTDPSHRQTHHTERSKTACMRDVAAVEKEVLSSRDLVGYQDTWWGIKRPCGVSRRDHAGATCSVCAAVGTKDITTLTSQVLKGSHDSVRSTHHQGTAM